LLYAIKSADFLSVLSTGTYVEKVLVLEAEGGGANN
jgi:hypothetical protein